MFLINIFTYFLSDPQALVDWSELQRNHQDEWLALLRGAFDDLDRDKDGTVWVDDLIAKMKDRLPPAEVRTRGVFHV
jgi:hypothetical protein